jgi:hypothetical protein
MALNKIMVALERSPQCSVLIVQRITGKKTIC